MLATEEEDAEHCHGDHDPHGYEILLLNPAKPDKALNFVPDEGEVALGCFFPFNATLTLSLILVNYHSLSNSLASQKGNYRSVSNSLGSTQIISSHITAL